MNAKREAEPAPSPTDPVRIERTLATPDAYVSLEADAPEREGPGCGERRLGPLLGRRKVRDGERAILAERCYHVAPGGNVRLLVGFHRGGEAVRPEGPLLLRADRGRLSATRIDLDGSDDAVEVDYQAPDETIRVSIRALLEGFHRGKIHLHLDPD